MWGAFKVFLTVSGSIRVSEFGGGLGEVWRSFSFSYAPRAVGMMQVHEYLHRGPRVTSRSGWNRLALFRYRTYGPDSLAASSIETALKPHTSTHSMYICMVCYRAAVPPSPLPPPPERHGLLGGQRPNRWPAWPARVSARALIPQSHFIGNRYVGNSVLC